MNRFARRSAAVASLAIAVPVLAVAPADAAAAKPRLPKGTITAKVVKIVDGDTLDVRYQGKIRRVQLLEEVLIGIALERESLRVSIS
jgi:micrococcal nuclease